MINDQSKKVDQLVHDLENGINNYYRFILMVQNYKGQRYFYIKDFVMVDDNNQLTHAFSNIIFQHLKRVKGPQLK